MSDYPALEAVIKRKLYEKNTSKSIFDLYQQELQTANKKKKLHWAKFGGVWSFAADLVDAFFGNG